MVSEFFIGKVPVSVVQHGTVIAGEDDQRVVRELEFVEFPQNCANRIVKFRDRIAPRTHRRLAHEAGIGNARHMNIVCRKIEKKGMVLLALNEGEGLSEEHVGHLLVFP